MLDLCSGYLLGHGRDLVHCLLSRTLRQRDRQHDLYGMPSGRLRQQVRGDNLHRVSGQHVHRFDWQFGLHGVQLHGGPVPHLQLVQRIKWRLQLHEQDHRHALQ